MGKDYACDEMFKLNVENNKASTSSVYMLSSINFWHARLCHINNRYEIGRASCRERVLMSV